MNNTFSHTLQPVFTIGIRDIRVFNHALIIERRACGEDLLYAACGNWQVYIFAKGISTKVSLCRLSEEVSSCGGGKFLGIKRLLEGTAPVLLRQEGLDRCRRSAKFLGNATHAHFCPKKAKMVHFSESDKCSVLQ